MNYTKWNCNIYSFNLSQQYGRKKIDWKDQQICIRAWNVKVISRAKIGLHKFQKQNVSYVNRHHIRINYIRWCCFTSTWSQAYIIDQNFKEVTSKKTTTNLQFSPWVFVVFTVCENKVIVKYCLVIPLVIMFKILEIGNHT